MKISRNYLRQLIREAVEEEVSVIYEAEASPAALDDYAAGDIERGHPEEAAADEVEAAGEDRASATISALRGWLSDTLASVQDLGISDAQVPPLVAAMDDLIASAQAGALTGSEDRVRKGIAQASGVDRSAE